MNTAPNTSVIRQLAAEKSHNARQRVLEAIQALQEQAQPVNFNTVSKSARVSKTFLYDRKHADLAERIRQSRALPRSEEVTAAQMRKTDPAKDVQIARLKERIQAAERELRELKRENELLWGRLSEQKPF